jgi:hypothetical protein
MLLGSGTPDPEDVKGRRLAACKTMLSLLSPEQRFTVAARLAQDVLAAVADNVMPVSDVVMHLLLRVVVIDVNVRLDACRLDAAILQ